jgi:hypothetical protein
VNVLSKLRGISTTAKIFLGVGAALVVVAIAAIGYWFGGAAAAAGAAGILGLFGLAATKRRRPGDLSDAAIDLAERAERDARSRADRARADAEAEARRRSVAREADADLAARRSAHDVSRELLGVDGGYRPGGPDTDDDP